MNKLFCNRLSFKQAFQNNLMERIKFSSDGRLKSIDGQIMDFFSGENEANVGFAAEKHELKTSNSLQFLREEKQINPILDESFWSLYSENTKFSPLKFSNGKTQEDVVKEVIDLIKAGNKIILIHGVCGTGKSAVALNIARILGKTSIVVPVKGLQRQYEEDYASKKYLIKKNGSRMKIAMITGRDNHDSIIEPGVSCASPFLPDTLKITEKNSEKIKEYYEQNPFIKNKELPELRKLKRIAIAPANPYWSPIRPADFELSMLKDAKKLRYRGLRGRDFIFYHRKPGCSYYDQYLAYIQADVIIFNSAKYKIEVALDRKPETEVDIIDEADEFLDNFSMQQDLNLTRLAASLRSISPDSPNAQEVIDEILNLIQLEEKNKQALGIDENKIFHVNETKVEKILKAFLKSTELAAEIMIDELNYANKALEVAENFKDFLDETYLTFRRYEKDIFVNLVSTNLSKRFQEIIEKSKALVLMSGTLHSEDILKKVFGLNDFKIVEAETQLPGAIEIHKTGKEFDCRYSNFNSKKNSRQDYLCALFACFEKAKKPVLIHVNAFEDLPSETEISAHHLHGLISREILRDMQLNDKTGAAISNFKKKLSSHLFTTKCSRGVDFPGDICNSIIFTKYPNPNINDTFWKLLQKTHPEYFWDFYKDKARREFLQRIYRALRFKDDHVYVLSPDLRVLDAVRELQKKK